MLIRPKFDDKRTTVVVFVVSLLLLLLLLLLLGDKFMKELRKEFISLVIPFNLSVFLNGTARVLPDGF